MRRIRVGLAGMVGLGLGPGISEAAPPLVEDSPFFAFEGASEAEPGEPCRSNGAQVGDDGWVEACARVVAPDTESPASALHRAKAVARREAVGVYGFSIQSGCVDLESFRNQTASVVIECMVATRARGIISREVTLSDGLLRLKPGGYERWVRMRLQVIEWTQPSGDGFVAHMSLGGTTVYRSGDRMRVEISTSQPARLYLLNVTEEGTTLLLPNEWHPDSRVDADEVFGFPPDALLNRGIELVVEAPDGRQSGRETLLLVALRGDRELPAVPRCPGFCEGEASEAGRQVAEFLRPLASMPSGSWTFAQAAYEVIQ